MFVLFLLSVICFLLVLLPIVQWDINKRRRKKYVKYFELFDAAIKLSDESSSYIRHESEFLEFHFKMLADGLREGECTEEYFERRIAELSKRYYKACECFKASKQQVETLFRAADKYAKENLLAWGMLYPKS
jgi:hypothetical protein